VEPVTRSCLVSLCGLLAACSEPYCGGSDVKYYDDALGHQLALRDIAYQFRRDGMVCVEGRHRAAFADAQREVDKYFHEVAYLLKDACEERAYRQWAEREKLRFDVRGRLFLLRSFNAEELAANRKRLADAPKGVSC
jgi:hypothetical protein